MVDAAMAADPKALADEVAGIRATGVPADVVAEALAPSVARCLGDKWCDDSIGFATVTIGCARLQGVLRSLGPDWYGTPVDQIDRPRILVIVPQKTDHSLGATVLTGKLRRLGYPVQLSLDDDIEAIAGTIDYGAFDLVMISASPGTPMDQLTEIVSVARGSTRGPLSGDARVAIGGPVLLDNERLRHRIRARTGADLVTNDLDEALRLYRSNPGIGSAALPSISIVKGS